MRATTYPGSTYDDVIAAPGNMVAELVDGELSLQPRPPVRCLWCAGGLLHSVESTAGSRGRGRGANAWIVLTEPELHLGNPNPRSRVMVPDVAAWRRTRMPVVPDEAAISLAPDWIAEILSPSTARFDRLVKMAAYADAGVSWAWLVDPDARSVEVWQRTESGQWLWLEPVVDVERARIPPFDDVELELTRWWPEQGPG